VLNGESLAKELLFTVFDRTLPPKTAETCDQRRSVMLNLDHIKITPRDQQVLQLLIQGCSNKEIASQLNISPRTVKQHLRTLFLRAGIRDGRKRVKLATAMFVKEQMKSCNPGSV
jgi:DNA-binding NarL/FixJ family response regulator